jgi:hypothetical protein
MDSSLVAHEELEKVFGKREHDGFKPKPNEHSTIANCDALLKLYKTVYTHPLIMANIPNFSQRLFCPLQWPKNELNSICL